MIKNANGWLSGGYSIKLGLNLGVGISGSILISSNPQIQKFLLQFGERRYGKLKFYYGLVNMDMMNGNCQIQWLQGMVIARFSGSREVSLEGNC